VGADWWADFGEMGTWASPEVSVAEEIIGFVLSKFIRFIKQY